jgi:nucleotide-binding universal stress UspA family protein
MAMSDVAAGRSEPAIVVGVDGSAAAWDALAWAAAEASATGHPLCIVHVAEWPVVADMWPVASLDRSAALRIAGAELVAEGVRRVRDVAPNLVMITQLEAGTDVADSLVRAAAGDAMIVLGKRRASRHWWSRHRRPTAVAVASRARCPVAVVELMGEARGDFAGRVVVLDEAPCEESPVMLFARRAARHRGIDVVVLAPGSPVPSCPTGAALVVLGARRSEGRRSMSVAATRALVTATGPTVVVPA